MPWQQRLLLAFSLTALAAMILACGGATTEKREELSEAGRREALADGDKLYAANDKAGAISKYKEGYPEAGQRKPDIIKRIVEFEVEKISSKSQVEAMKWIEKALEDNLTVPYSTPAARKMAADQNEYKEVKRIAEGIVINKMGDTRVTTDDFVHRDDGSWHLAGFVIKNGKAGKGQRWSVILAHKKAGWKTEEVDISDDFVP